MENCDEIFAPTVSHSATRYILIEPAARGWGIKQFDISNAFVRCALGDKIVLVRLPKHNEWSNGKQKGDVVRLLKSLYGLRCSPRRWYDHYRSVLEGLGWTCNPREPGLFTKKTKDEKGKECELLLAVYVDDNIIAGASDFTLKREMNAILDLLPGEEIMPEYDAKGYEIRDLLGAELKFCRKRKFMKISMASAIEKALAKFNMSQCKPVSSPILPNAGSVVSPKNTSFPIKSLVGCLLYISVISRPDIFFAVQKLATLAADPTDHAVAVGKRILQYLKGTTEIGLEYTPSQERNFRKTYQSGAEAEGKSYKNTIAFCDADFAGCTLSLKSTSGVILYHRSTPICWKSKRQSLRATSTMEAEYCSMYDCIRLTFEQSYLDWLTEHESKNFPLVFNDNRSALCLANTSVATKRSKHMMLRLHTVRDYVKDLCYINTDLNLADPLTKPLAGNKYIHIFKCPERKAVVTEFRACYMDFDAGNFKLCR